MPNQRARREEQKFSLSARKPTEGSVICSGRLGPGEEIHLYFTDAPAAELDIAGAETIILLGCSAASHLGDQRASHSFRCTFGEHAGFGRSRVCAVPHGVDARILGL